MILESIVTTLDAQSNVNLAPMGPVLRNPKVMQQSGTVDPEFLLRPFAVLERMTTWLPREEPRSTSPMMCC